MLRCGSGSERNDTHHSIRDTMFYIMREAGYSVRRELGREQSRVMPIREGEAGGRVMDLVAADPRGGSRVLADVVVADPTRSTAVMVTAVERGHAARSLGGCMVRCASHGCHACCFDSSHPSLKCSKRLQYWSNRP
jgi:hypothetical protein